MAIVRIPKSMVVNNLGEAPVSDVLVETDHVTSVYARASSGVRSAIVNVRFVSGDGLTLFTDQPDQVVGLLG